MESNERLWALGCGLWAQGDELHGEEILRKAHRLIDKTGVEVDVRVELPGDEIFVLQRNPLQLQRDLEQRALAGHLEYFVGDALDDLRARVVRLVHAVAE